MGVREGLLALLARGPRHGYQLKLEFESATGDIWPLNVGQIYTTLQRLERDGLVVPHEEDDEGRISYGLTSAGREELGRWFAQPIDRKVPRRDELTIKLLLAIAGGAVDPRQVLTVQRDATMTALQDYTRLKADATDDELAWSLQLDRLIMVAEAELRWLDRVEDKLAGPWQRPLGPGVVPEADTAPAAQDVGGRGVLGREA